MLGLLSSEGGRRQLHHCCGVTVPAASFLRHHITAPRLLRGAGNRTEKINVSTRIRLGLIKPGSIYARFGELTPFKAPRDEQQALWKQCGFNEENARKARMLFPPVQTMHGMVPLEPAAGQLAAMQGRPGLQLMQLALAAAAGAGAALAYLRRARTGGGARPVLQVHAIGAQHR